MTSTELIDEPNSVIAARQTGLLRTMVGLCAQRHPYYSKLFAEKGIEPAEIDSIEALQRLPLTYKSDFLGDPRAFVLQTDGLPDLERTTWDVAYTTGTTGNPTPFSSTTYDFHRIIHLSRRMCTIRGITEQDTVANLFPLMTYPQGAFIRVAAAAIGTGFKLLTATPGPRADSEIVVHRSTDEIVEWLSRTRPSVLWGVASYIRRLAMRAAELGVSWPDVRLLALSGEPLSTGFRDDLRARFATLGAADLKINNSLGMTEMQGGLIECTENSGQHNPAPELYLFEVVDEQTGRQVPDGERGLLTLTHLDRRGTVLLRYVVGDLIAQTHERCEHCGREGTRLLRNPTRTSELFKVKATLVDPNVVAAELARYPAIEEYRLVFTKEVPDDPYSPDAMVIQIAGKGVDDVELKARIADDIKAAVAVRPKIEIVLADEIYDPQTTMKSRRVIDIRPKHYET